MGSVDYPELTRHRAAHQKIAFQELNWAYDFVAQNAEEVSLEYLGLPPVWLFPQARRVSCQILARLFS